MRRRDVLLGLAGAWLPRLYSFHIFGLLEPRQLTVETAEPAVLAQSGRENQIRAGEIFSFGLNAAPVSLIGRDGRAAKFILSIPGSIQRRFTGKLQIGQSGGVLVPVIQMDAETAVSSIVGAELPAGNTPVQAFSAQAIVARSFLRGAGRRHPQWDFCDTTHCQFLRSPAAPGSEVLIATGKTSGLTLWNDGKVIPARYSAACGGHTEEREELGYRYRAVSCEVCKAEGLSRRGHGLGLCQMGAIGLARRGWPHDRILAKYFPAAYIGK